MQAAPAPTTNLLALPDGTELVGDYRIKRVLGAGGFGITYLAEEKALARLVTVKEYFPADFAARRGTGVSPRSHDLAGDYQWGLDRFIDEAQTLARFDHPNIVRVHRYFRANDTAYMVLRFEEGGSFKSWLKGLKRAPRQTELDTIIAPLLDALEIIHKANFLHRDIAPDNIMMRGDRSPVLIDFGSARGEVASHSKTVSALVKPGYSPYEQYATTGSKQGPWTDIYALGATLYHAITGKRPPDAPTRVLNDEYVPARDAALSSYRSGFLAAIDQALRIEIDERPQSIAEWRGALLAPDAKREPALLGLRLPVVRTLGRLRGKRAALAARTDEPPPPVATVALTEGPKSLVPAPPDAPQPKGQLLDFIDALKKHGQPILAPKKKKAAKPRPEPAAKPAVAEARKVARPAPRVLQPAAAKRRAASRPRGARGWKLPSRRWRSAMWKVAIAVAVASFAVAYQDKPPRTESRGAGVISSQALDLAQPTQLVAHKGPVVALGTSEHDRWIVSAGVDATLRIWNAGSGALVRTIELDEGAVTALAVDGRRALAGHKGGAVVLWDLERAEKLVTFQHGAGAVVSVGFTSDPHVVAILGQDTAVALFDINAPTAPATLLEGRDGADRFFAAARLRGFLVAGGVEGTLRLWRTDTLNVARNYRSQHADMAGVDIAADGRYVAAAGVDGVVRVWSSTSSRAVRVFRAHDGPVVALAFGPERLLATAGEDGRIKVWNLRAGRLVRALKDKAGPARALSFSGEGRRLFSAGADGVIRMWPLLPSPSASGI